MYLAPWHTPLALGGDTLSANNIVIAVVSLLSIVAGYLVLAGLWYFVFRQKPADPADGQPPPGAAPAEPPEKALATKAPREAPPRLQRRPGARFPRR